MINESCQTCYSAERRFQLRKLSQRLRKLSQRGSFSIVLPDIFGMLLKEVGRLPYVPMPEPGEYARLVQLIGHPYAG